MSASASGQKELRNTLVSNINPRALGVLFDLFEGNKKDDPAQYFGREHSPPQPTNLARGLSKNYTEETEEFLDKRESEFTPSDIKTNTARQLLVEMGDVPPDMVKRASKDFDNFLALIYHQFYDTDAGKLNSEYDALLAQATLFKSNNETVYYHDEPLPLDQLETNIQAYIRKANADSDRPRTARVYPSDDTAVLKLFNETSETRKAVFKQRTDKSTKLRQPEITHQPSFNVKTMRMKAENLGDKSKITFSKSTNGWENDLELFLEQTFNIPGGLSTLSQRRLDGADRVLDAAKEVAEGDSSDDDDVADHVENILSELAEETLEQLDDDDSVPDQDLDAAEKRYESLQLQGVRVRNDGDTHMADFVLRSQDAVQDVTDEVDEMGASLMALLAKADRENINLIFRGIGLQGSHEEFEVYSGNWTTRSRGIPQDGIAAYDALFATTTNE